MIKSFMFYNRFLVKVKTIYHGRYKMYHGRYKIEQICAGVHAAILHCAATRGTDVEGLRHDIRNSLSHVVGELDNCRRYFCNRQKAVESTSALKDDENVMNFVQTLI